MAGGAANLASIGYGPAPHVPPTLAASPATTASFRYLVQTFGCQMNAHDSDRMGGVLRAAGGVAVECADDADLVVFNTCSVREKAEQKLRSEVGKLAPLKSTRPDLVIAVAGCVAQQEGEKLLARIRHIDLVVGPDNIAELPALVLEQLGGRPPGPDRVRHAGPPLSRVGTEPSRRPRPSRRRS